jgi:hypothetical protein
MKLWLRALPAILWMHAAVFGCGGRVEITQQGQAPSGVGGSIGSGGSPGVGGSTAIGGSRTLPDARTCGVVRASDYDQSCTSDFDCVGVFSGDTCGDCSCPNATINKSAAPAYFPHAPFFDPRCSCPITGTPTCVGGVCIICTPSGC